MARSKKAVRYVVAPGPDVDLDRDDIRDSQGRRITREYADAAVADVHERIGRGRPSLSGDARTSPQLTFRLPPELRAQAEAQAAREGRRVSDVAREALAEYLARRAS